MIQILVLFIKDFENLIKSEKKDSDIEYVNYVVAKLLQEDQVKNQDIGVMISYL